MYWFGPVHGYRCRPFSTIPHIFGLFDSCDEYPQITLYRPLEYRNIMYQVIHIACSERQK